MGLFANSTRGLGIVRVYRGVVSEFVIGANMCCSGFLGSDGAPSIDGTYKRTQTRTEAADENEGCLEHMVSLFIFDIQC